jgi:hypothetical protein
MLVSAASVLYRPWWQGMQRRRDRWQRCRHRRWRSRHMRWRSRLRRQNSWWQRRQISHGGIGKGNGGRSTLLSACDGVVGESGGGELGVELFREEEDDPAYTVTVTASLLLTWLASMEVLAQFCRWGSGGGNGKMAGTPADVRARATTASPAGWSAGEVAIGATITLPPGSGRGLGGEQ